MDDRGWVPLSLIAGFNQVSLLVLHGGFILEKSPVLYCFATIIQQSIRKVINSLVMFWSPSIVVYLLIEWEMESRHLAFFIHSN